MKGRCKVIWKKLELGKIKVNDIEYDWKATRPIAEKELNANARLISAAPELLSVLKHLNKKEIKDICLSIQLNELIKRIENEQ